MWDSMTVWFINSVGKYVSDGIGGLSFFFFSGKPPAGSVFGITHSVKESSQKRKQLSDNELLFSQRNS